MHRKAAVIAIDWFTKRNKMIQSLMLERHGMWCCTLRNKLGFRAQYTVQEQMHNLPSLESPERCTLGITHRDTDARSIFVRRASKWLRIHQCILNYIRTVHVYRLFYP